MRRVAISILLFLGLVSVGFLPHLIENLYLTVAARLVFFAVAHFVAVRMGLGGLTGFGLRLHRGWGRNVAVGLALGTASIVGWVGANWLAGSYASAAFVPFGEIAGLAVLLVLDNLYIAFCEEIVGRGYLLRVLPQRFSTGAVLLIGGLVHTAMHLPRLGGVDHYFWPFWFLSGIMFMAAVLHTRSLWLGVGLHWGLNVAWFLLAAETWLLATPGPNFNGWLMLVIPLVLVVAVRLIATRLSAKVTGVGTTNLFD